MNDFDSLSLDDEATQAQWDALVDAYKASQVRIAALEQEIFDVKALVSDYISFAALGRIAEASEVMGDLDTWVNGAVEHHGHHIPGR